MKRLVGSLLIAFFSFGWAAACSSNDGGGSSSGGSGGASGDSGADVTVTGGTSTGGTGTAGANTGGTGTGATGGSTTGGAAGTAGAGGSTFNDANYSPDCTGVCQKRAALGCPNDDALQDCIDKCEVSRQTGKLCEKETDATFACMATPAAQFYCDPYSGTSQYVGCEDALWSASTCMACVATDNDDGCDICSKHACCAEYVAFATAANVQDLVKCAEACSGAACVAACKSQYPSAGAALDAVTACRDTKCPGSCADGSGPDAGTTVDAITEYCNTWVATGCAPWTDPIKCQAENKSALQILDGMGCGMATYLTLSCAASHSVSCDPDAGAVGDPSCDIATACTQSSENCASYWSANDECGVGCGTWFGSCQPGDAGAGLTCTCDKGNNQGKVFQLATDCGEVATYVDIRTNCK